VHVGRFSKALLLQRKMDTISKVTGGTHRLLGCMLVGFQKPIFEEIQGCQALNKLNGNVSTCHSRHCSVTLAGPCCSHLIRVYQGNNRAYAEAV